MRREIGRVVGLLTETGFTVQTHASGTNIEGEPEDILIAVGLVHEVLHRQGSVRLLSYLKLETRSDKVPTLAGKALKHRAIGVGAAGRTPAIRGRGRGIPAVPDASPA